MQVLDKLEKTLDHASVALDEAIALMRAGRAVLDELQPSVAALPRLLPPRSGSSTRIGR